MSAFSRLLHAPASRRTFSSYFSSKSGGGSGRYFNSAKQQPVAGKVASVTASTTKVDAASSVEGKQDGVSSSVDAAGSSSSSAASSNNNNTATSTTTGSSQGSTPVENPSSVLAEFTHHHHQQQQQQQHLAISAKDFKMHQFFSLHRPLLLINQPSTIFRGVPAGSSFGLSPAPQQQQHAKEGDATTGPLGVQYQHLGLDAPLDPFVDADAEAARQLTRALTLAKASPALEWEATLKRLGLDVAQDADRVGLQAQFAREWEEVLMDSTKRKRRKKMKKHKLKKRRRATRSERLRMK